MAAKLFQVIVPNEEMVSRIVNSGNQVHELMVIEREDKKFVAEHNKDLEKPALYILVNRDANKLYVGETDDSIKRLRNHEAKDFWTEALVFHSTTETLSTTEVKWLEAKAYETIANLGYYDLSENKQKPQFPKLKKYQELDLEPIFLEAKSYVCAAGFDIFIRTKEAAGVEIPQPIKTIPKVQPKKEREPKVWMISASPKFFDHKACFDELGQIYWKQNNNFHVGDVGYIYFSKPKQEIVYKFEVIAIDLPYSDEMAVERKYYKKVLDFDASKEHNRYFVIKKIGESLSGKLTLNNLLQNGLKAAPLGPLNLSDKSFEKLLKYIEENF